MRMATWRAKERLCNQCNAYRVHLSDIRYASSGICAMASQLMTCYFSVVDMEGQHVLHLFVLKDLLVSAKMCGHKCPGNIMSHNLLCSFAATLRALDRNVSMYRAHKQS